MKTPEAVHGVLLSVNWQSALVYREDIIAASKNVKNQMVRLEKVLTSLWDVGVILKLKKCLFLAK